MNLTVTFLGTGGSVPTARRSTASVLISRGGERLMFDCGEGTQRQLQRSLGLVQVDEIFLTHFHADHLLGLPGLLKTYDLGAREAPLTIYGPAGLEKLFVSLEGIFGRPRYPVKLEEIEAGERLAGDGYEIRAFAVDHRVPALGYALAEDDRPGRFDAGAAERLGVAPGRDFGRLQAGETVDGSDGPVAPDQVLGESRPGRTVVITGDTTPCPGDRGGCRRRPAPDPRLELRRRGGRPRRGNRALDRPPGRQPWEPRRTSALLALVHISSRYHVGAILDEARRNSTA